MASRRRRSSIELEVQTNMPTPYPSVEASHVSLSPSNATLGDIGGVEQQLEPADGGAAAWKVLCATFMFEAVLFGEHHLSFYRTMLSSGRKFPTEQIDFRLLCVIWCLPKLLREAPRVQE